MHGDVGKRYIVISSKIDACTLTTVTHNSEKHDKTDSKSKFITQFPHEML